MPNEGAIRFYKRDRPDFEFLSNFFEAPVQIEGVLWAHTEPYYQAQKSGNPENHALIREHENPLWSKYVGDSRVGHPETAQQSWFRRHPKDRRSVWDDVKLDFMRVALKANFTQHEFLRLSLLATLDAGIIEDFTSDHFCGIGVDGSRSNQLERLLMAQRIEFN